MVKQLLGFVLVVRQRDVSLSRVERKKVRAVIKFFKSDLITRLQAIMLRQASREATSRSSSGEEKPDAEVRNESSSSFSRRFSPRRFLPSGNCRRAAKEQLAALQRGLTNSATYEISARLKAAPSNFSGLGLKSSCGGA